MISNLLAARLLISVSLAFHIMFAVFGMVMPLFMAISEGLWLKTKKDVYLLLAKRWAKGTAVMFAIGAVSGTIVSFELGLLWPKFMAFAGPIIGMPFSLEGFAFFLEAIFLGIYLYGWKKVSPAIHLASGIIVFICAMMSGVFIVTVNGWMNTPSGFTLIDGVVTHIDPFAAMWNPSAFTEILHMLIAAIAALAFAVAGIHAYKMRNDPKNLFHRKAFAIVVIIAWIASILQVISGDMSGKHVAQTQPIKFAALEGHFKTEHGAPLNIFGIPDEKNGVTRFAIRIPYGLSLLAYNHLDAEVKGLNDFPQDERPPVAITHIAFQLMILLGFFMFGVSLIGLMMLIRFKRIPDNPWYLRLMVWTTPMGFIALQAGWVVTEVGRQPWIIQKIMRTRDAVTTMPGLAIPLIAFTLLYIFLSVVVFYILRKQVSESPQVINE